VPVLKTIYNNSMFKKLTDFKYRRKAKEAFGFYIAYLILVVLLGSLVAGLLGSLITAIQGFEGGVKVISLVSIVSCVTLSYLIIKSKNLTNKFGPILLVVLSGVLAIGGGGLLGLIPTAFLTMKK
jgi:hypothetical protein